MANFLSEWSAYLDAVQAVNGYYLTHFSALSQFVTFVTAVVAIVKWGRLQRSATIFVVNVDDLEKPRKKIGCVSARFLSRAEVNGVISQRAGGVRLDFSQSKFDYRFRNEIAIGLPNASYDAVSGL